MEAKCCQVILRIAAWPLALSVCLGCSSAEKDRGAPGGASSDAGEDGAAPLAACLDAPHEGLGTVSFQANGNAVELTATAGWLMSTWLIIDTHNADAGSGAWGMTLTPTDVGTYTCAPSTMAAFAMIYGGSAVSTCTLEVVERIPRFKAHFQATATHEQDAEQSTVVLSNGEIDVAMPGWCY